LISTERKPQPTILGSEGTDCPKTSSLKEARTHSRAQRKKQSSWRRKPGYYVYHCPMLKKDWVQTSTTTVNPYAGKDMLGCGEIRNSMRTKLQNILPLSRR